MAKYTIISDIGKGLVSLLRDKLVPEPVDKGESIGICDPKDRGGYIVGIHPYDIKEDTSGRATENTTLPDGSVQDPPAMIELYYVVSVCSKAEIETKALDEAKIIGKIIQIFKDNPTIPPRYMPNNVGMPIENVPISMLPLNMEEKVKVWTMFGESYKLSVFYVVGPIAIDSENIHKAKKKVETVYLSSDHFSPKKTIEFATHIKDEDIDDEYTERPDEDEDEEEEDDFSDDEESSDDESSLDDEESSDDSESDDELSSDEDESENENGDEGEEEDFSGEDEDLSDDESGADDLDAGLDEDSDSDADSSSDSDLDSDLDENLDDDGSEEPKEE